MTTEDWKKQHVVDLKDDVADYRKYVAEAEQQVAEAIKWHQKMLLDYAKRIIALADAEKDLNTYN